MRLHGPTHQRSSLSRRSIGPPSQRHKRLQERCRHDASARAAALAERSLAEERGRHDASAQAASSVELALAEERGRHDVSARAAALAELALVEEGCRHIIAAQAAELAALTLAEEQCRLEAAAVATAPPSNGHVDTLPHTLILLGCCRRSKRERVSIIGSAISFGDAIASVGVSSSFANGSCTSSCESSSSHWPAQWSTSAQSSG